MSSQGDKEELASLVQKLDGGLYATPSEFVRDILREKKEQQEAAALRDGVLEGYSDLLHGRMIEFTGQLSDALAVCRASP